jgi:N utilization substance protein A
LEVPEIYNGQVDIKSIAREAGARSKVGVVAMQPGIDPVGACVGMRGVRIQSIVRELSDEKIDVIEWDPDQKTFIAKALSPARVSQVFLEDHPDAGRTAIVIVPDDQLSLAIGREGQNARLAAKLTGWRIDIKSLTEAASESLKNLGDPAADPAVAKDKDLIGKAELVMAKKEANRPITSEDFMVLTRLVAGIEGKIVATRAAKYDMVHKARAEARKDIPDITYEVPLDELELSTRVQGLLEGSNVTTLGDAMLRLSMGDEALLEISGFGAKALDEVKEAISNYDLDALIEEAEPEASEAEALAEDEVEAELETDAEGAEDTAAEEVTEAEVEVVEAEEETSEPLEAEEVEEEVVEEVEEPAVPDIDDLGKSLVQTDKPETTKKKVVVVQPTALAEEETDDEKGKQKSKELVYDEDRGEVVAKRKRKDARSRPNWEEYEEMDVDEIFEEGI